MYGENGEVVYCKFQRVDLNTLPTILSYCSDVISTIGNTLDSTGQLTIETEEEYLYAKKEQISSFGKQLNESEKEKSISLVKSAKKLVANFGIKYFKKSLEKEYYKGRYESYCADLDEVAKDDSCLIFEYNFSNLTDSYNYLKSNSPINYKIFDQPASLIVEYAFYGKILEKSIEYLKRDIIYILIDLV